MAVKHIDEAKQQAFKTNVGKLSCIALKEQHLIRFEFPTAMDRVELSPEHALHWAKAIAWRACELGLVDEREQIERQDVAAGEARQIEYKGKASMDVHPNAVSGSVVWKLPEVMRYCEISQASALLLARKFIRASLIVRRPPGVDFDDADPDAAAQQALDIVVQQVMFEQQQIVMRDRFAQMGIVSADETH